MAFNEHGAALGLVFDGQMVSHQSQQPLTYVTPIEDVFEDIKGSSRGNIWISASCKIGILETIYWFYIAARIDIPRIRLLVYLMVNAKII